TNAFFDTAADHETLLIRPRDITDNAIPSGTALATDVLLRAGSLLEKRAWIEIGRSCLEQLAPTAARAPLGFGRLLCALDFELAKPIELAIIGATPGSRKPFIDRLRRRYLPNLVLAGGAEGDLPDIPLLRDRRAVDGRATAYLCEAFVCQLPTAEPAQLETQIDLIAPVITST
ncbi:MAG TPA: thioredoxin domain-containing protein, partial [Candidatus Dormibacteraeota bacterium]